MNDFNKISPPTVPIPLKPLVDCWVFFGQCLFVFQAVFFRSRSSRSTSFGVRYPRAE